MKPITLWIVAVVFGIAVVGVGVFLAFNRPLFQTRTLSGPIAIVQSREPPTHGFLGLGFETEPPMPLTVTHVLGGTGAARAGIESGDVIVAIDEFTSPTVEDVLRITRNSEPDSTVRVTILRDDVEQELDVELIGFSRLILLTEQQRGQVNVP